VWRQRDNRGRIKQPAPSPLIPSGLLLHLHLGGYLLLWINYPWGRFWESSISSRNCLGYLEIPSPTNPERWTGRTLGTQGLTLSLPAPPGRFPPCLAFPSTVSSLPTQKLRRLLSTWSGAELKPSNRQLHQHVVLELFLKLMLVSNTCVMLTMCQILGCVLRWIILI
jgi:hypothetical protein